MADLHGVRVIVGEQGCPGRRADGRNSRYERWLDLAGRQRQKSVGSMASYCICCGVCCAPAVCRCAC